MDVKAGIEEFKTQLVAGLGENFVAMVFYGSQAEGSQHPMSDTDLCIVVNEATAGAMEYIKQLTERNHNSGYDPHVVERREFIDYIRAGDVYYKGEVVGKGKVIFDREGLFSGLERMDTNFALAEVIHKSRHLKEKENIHYHLQTVLERMQFDYSHLTSLRFARTCVAAPNLQEVPNLMEQDSVLEKYADDFRRILELKKSFRHGEIGFPFDEVGTLSRRLQQLADDVGV